MRTSELAQWWQQGAAAVQRCVVQQRESVLGGRSDHRPHEVEIVAEDAPECDVESRDVEANPHGLGPRADLEQALADA